MFSLKNFRKAYDNCLHDLIGIKKWQTILCFKNSTQKQHMLNGSPAIFLDLFSTEPELKLNIFGQ